MKLNLKMGILLYIFFDLVCVGLGMGVPIFCILLGFPLGWYIARRASAQEKDFRLRLQKILKFSVLASGFTFLLMLGIWGWSISVLFDSGFDFANFGHPFILYDPKISFIGWLILMIFISPFLQLLTTIFAAFVTLAGIKKWTERI